MLLRLLPGLAMTERDPLDGVIVIPQPLSERRRLGDLPRPAARRAARWSIVGETPIARALAAIAGAAGYEVGAVAVAAGG